MAGIYSIYFRARLTLVFSHIQMMHAGRGDVDGTQSAKGEAIGMA